jgi:hypothetical protein
MPGVSVQPGSSPPRALPEQPEPPELDEGPYGLRGKDTPPLSRMFGAYAIIFGVVIMLPLIVFIVVRFVIL